jgi:hypothetical protein
MNEKGFSHHLIAPILAILTVGAIGSYMLTHSNAATCRDYTYRQGSSGTCVRNIQGMINYVSYLYNGTLLTVDGSFGPKTVEAVKRFQSIGVQIANRDARIPAVTSDGVVGPKTWDKLCKTNLVFGADKIGTELRMGSYGVSAGCPLSWVNYTWVKL